MIKDDTPKPSPCKMCGKIVTTPLEAMDHLMDHPEVFSEAIQAVIKAQQAKKNERLR